MKVGLKVVYPESHYCKNCIWSTDKCKNTMSKTYNQFTHEETYVEDCENFHTKWKSEEQRLNAKWEC